MSEKKKGQTWNIKPDDEIHYTTLHHWVVKKKGKPKKCEHCGQTKDWMHWANKSHEYKRDINDWIALCVPCHSKYDKDRGDIKEIYDKTAYKKS